jgi:transcription-repair coupling factor (superfamily II helicase)
VAASARRAQALADAARALCPEAAVAHLPGWDCFPYDRMPPSKACMGARMGVLRWLTDAAHPPGLVLTTPAALVRRVPPRTVWAYAHHDIRVGDAFDAAALEGALGRAGYRFDDRVDEPGEAAFRPHVLDLFPAAAPLPCRVEHEDGRVVAIRSYDPATQTGEAETRHLVVDPASEIVRPPDAAPAPLPYGAEHRLAERYDALETVFDYCPDARLTLEEEADGLVRDALAEVRDAYEIARAVRETGTGARPPLPPEALHLTPQEWEDARSARRPEIVAADAADGGRRAALRDAGTPARGPSPDSWPSAARRATGWRSPRTRRSCRASCAGRAAH